MVMHVMSILLTHTQKLGIVTMANEHWWFVCNDATQQTAVCGMRHSHQQPFPAHKNLSLLTSPFSFLDLDDKQNDEIMAEPAAFSACLDHLVFNAPTHTFVNNQEGFNTINNYTALPLVAEVDWIMLNDFIKTPALAIPAGDPQANFPHLAQHGSRHCTCGVTAMHFQGAGHQSGCIHCHGGNPIPRPHGGD